jgi:hypothetical protein
MSRDAFEFDIGGLLHDQYGRQELLVVQKHVAPATTDSQRGYEPTDGDGRKQIVLLDNTGFDVFSTLKGQFPASGLGIGSGAIRETGGNTMLYSGEASYRFLSGSINVATAGKGLAVAEGSNAKQGVSGAMSGGSVVVANTSITANSRLFLTRQGGGINPGAVYELTRTAGTSFTIASTNPSDTGTVAYEIFEPAV